MAATTYTDPKEYLKFLKKKCLGEHHQDSPCEGGCKEGCDDKCSCCPPGLVAIYDDKGNHTGCLTPSDAELYQKNTFTCLDGYVKLIRNETQEFIGCVSESEFVTMYNAVNPPA